MAIGDEVTIVVIATFANQMLVVGGVRTPDPPLESSTKHADHL